MVSSCLAYKHGRHLIIWLIGYLAARLFNMQGNNLLLTKFVSKEYYDNTSVMKIEAILLVLNNQTLYTEWF